MVPARSVARGTLLTRLGQRFALIAPRVHLRKLLVSNRVQLVLLGHPQPWPPEAAGTAPREISPLRLEVAPARNVRQENSLSREKVSALYVRQERRLVLVQEAVHSVLRAIIAL